MRFRLRGWPACAGSASVVGIATTLAFGMGACGSSSDPTHAALPQITYAGGSVLVSPAIVGVAFAGDPMAADLEAFSTSLTTSSWWFTVTSGDCTGTDGGCIGAGGPSSFVQLAESAPASFTDSTVGGDSTLQAWIAGHLASGELPAPSPGAVSSTVYVIYVPQTTMVTYDGVASCSPGGFGGYHAWIPYGGAKVPYAVVDECMPGSSFIPGVAARSILQQTTVAGSHEIVEATTDPIPPTGYALDLANPDNWPWVGLTGGGEFGDLCVDLFGINQDQTTEGAYTVQRIWSNASAAANTDPCVPVPGGATYFNAAPEKPFLVLPVGGSTTFEVDAFSYESVGAWTVLAYDYSDPGGPGFLSFSISGGTLMPAGPSITVHDGSVLHVTVTLNFDPAVLPSGVASAFFLSYQGALTAPTAAHFWPMAVISDAEAADAGISIKAALPSIRAASFAGRSPMHL